jgi:hypothetical protein
MEQLGYTVRAIGDRWYWGNPKGISPTPELLKLQEAVNASDENSGHVLKFLVKSGRVGLARVAFSRLIFQRNWVSPRCPSPGAAGFA